MKKAFLIATMLATFNLPAKADEMPEYAKRAARVLAIQDFERCMARFANSVHIDPNIACSVYIRMLKSLDPK